MMNSFVSLFEGIGVRCTSPLQKKIVDTDKVFTKNKY